MAALMQNFVLNCRHVFRTRIAFGASNFQNLPIKGISTSGSFSKKHVRIFSPRRFEKMMSKKKKKFYFDPMNTSQLGKMTGSNLNSKKYGDKFGQKDSVKLRVYNTILYEHIVDLVNSNYISDELEQLQIPILSVRMAGDMSVARVYWQASGNAESDDKIQAVLERYTGRVRHALISLRVLGNVPRVCFLKDKAAANIAEIDHLLASADFGPDYEEFLTDENPSEIKLDSQHNLDGLHWQGKLSHKRGNKYKRNDEEPEDILRYKGPNFFAVDHADALSQIASHKKRDSVNVPEGFSPITDSIEQFKVFQKKKKIRKMVDDDDASALYRGQLENMSDNTREEEFELEAQDFDDGLDDLEESSDFQAEHTDDDEEYGTGSGRAPDR